MLLTSLLWLSSCCLLYVLVVLVTARRNADARAVMMRTSQVFLPNWIRFGQSLVPQLMGGEGDTARLVTRALDRGGL